MRKIFHIMQTQHEETNMPNIQIMRNDDQVCMTLSMSASDARRLADHIEEHPEPRLIVNLWEYPEIARNIRMCASRIPTWGNA